ncbi:hypothetical protein OHB35_14790 [Streptomyces phaeochromogenes]|uniref:ATP-grasp domain-containing protein n=1 Tax=Streptomyces phaeochromogenes TaxID=1923 RepID=A0ABZ1HB98_STRPH|nr:hypothetical protein [Streptomyces phaeochromogenes]WSD14408.1 hypothetical protein OHB35_14790 [Streptomyces phaeochromogenes]
MLHVELRLTASGPRVIEVNGRPPATRGPYRRTTQGGFGMVAAYGITTAHAAQASASCQVRPDQHQ